jgi:lipid A 3-O-deacylase
MERNPVKTMLSATVLFVPLVTLSTPAAAQQIFGGLYLHDVTHVGRALGLGAAGRESGTYDLHLGYRSDRLDGLSWLGRPQAQTYISINSDGLSNYISASLGWSIPLTERAYLRPGFGLAYTDGAAGLPPANAPNLSDEERARRTELYFSRIDFGSRLLFNPELALGVKLSDRWAAEFSYSHLSHGQIFHKGKNQGLDDAGVRLVYSF